MTHAENEYFKALSPDEDPVWVDKMEALDRAMEAVALAELALTRADDLISSTHTSQALAMLVDDVQPNLSLAKMELED